MVAACNILNGDHYMSQPAHKFRDGVLQVTIWRNPGERGNWYSVIPSRSYKKGDDWKETESLGFDDLLAMSKLLSHAHSWIIDAKRADTKVRKESAKKDSESQESAQAAA
jgi:hypothetical protein